MRVFFSAGEASGDAYGARLVQALDERGAFSAKELALDLVRELRDDPCADRTLARVGADCAKFYGTDSLPRGYLEGSESWDDLAERVAEAVGGGAIDGRRLRLESLAAVGGRRLKEAGAGLLVDSSSWGAVGIVESLGVVPRVAEGYQHARGLLRTAGHGLFVPIDFGYVNVKLAREAKRRGWKVVYFVPPGSWRRDKQGRDIPGVADAVVTPFAWSADILRSMGANAHFFGHPLKQMVGPPGHGDRHGVAVLPGSRWHEVRYNLPVLAAALDGLGEKARFAVAPNLDASTLQEIWERIGGGEADFSTDTYGVLKGCRAAVVCSGTATLEAALCRCPTVVVYRGSWLMELEYRLRRPKFDHVSLPNILLQRSVLPELVQWDATPEAVRARLDDLLADTPARASQLGAFDELDAMLGPGDCFDKTADLVLETARS